MLQRLGDVVIRLLSETLKRFDLFKLLGGYLACVNAEVLLDFWDLKYSDFLLVSV